MTSLASMDLKKNRSTNLLDSIDASRDAPLERLILGLGIPFVGKETAELLADYAGSIDVLVDLTEEELVNIEGIGAKGAESIISFFDNPVHLREIQELRDLGVRPKSAPRKKKSDHAFSGKTFVLTGSLEHYTRTEASALVKERGGKTSSSVSKKTDYVLAGSEPGSKYDKAKKLGVKILSEKEFAQSL